MKTPETFPERVARIEREQNVGPAIARRIATAGIRIEQAKRDARTAALAESLRQANLSPGANRQGRAGQ